MEVKIVEADYPGGHIDIHLEEFFPAQSKKIRNLFKLVLNQMFDWGKRDKLVSEIISYLDESISQHGDKAILRNYANVYADDSTRASELQEDIDKWQKQVDALKSAVKEAHGKEAKRNLKDQLAEKRHTLGILKARQKNYRDTARLAKRAFEDNQKLVKKLKSNRELVMQLKDRRFMR